MRSFLSNKIVLLLFVLLFSFGCKKEGIGGKGEIKGYATFNGKVIKSTTFYIKYGTKSSPGSDVSKYDGNSTGDSDGKFHFKELNQGDYYIYTVGAEGGQTLTGGMHVELEKNQIKDNIVIPVNP